MEDIEQYHLRSMIGFISGRRPLEEFQEYVQRIRVMGVDEAARILDEAWRLFYAKPVGLFHGK